MASASSIRNSRPPAGFMAGRAPRPCRRDSHECAPPRAFRGCDERRIRPVDVNHASLLLAAGISIGAAATAGGAVAHAGASPSPLQTDELSSFISTTGGATAAIVETASPLSVGPGNGRAASPTTESMTVTTDKADYAPGSTATFIVAGVNSGSSVAFQIADLASDPGINGIADVYAPFTVTDGGPGDSDSLANGAVVANGKSPPMAAPPAPRCNSPPPPAARPRPRRSATRQTRRATITLYLV